MSTENKLKPYLLSDFIQTEKEGKLAIKVHSPQCPNCPNCLNVDGRLSLQHDKYNSTIIKIQSFLTSGHIMRCLCCENEFEWSTGNVDYGILTIKHERLNDVLIPIEYFSTMLGVDVYKYI